MSTHVSLAAIEGRVTSLIRTPQSVTPGVAGFATYVFSPDLSPAEETALADLESQARSFLDPLTLSAGWWTAGHVLTATDRKTLALQALPSHPDLNAHTSLGLAAAHAHPYAASSHSHVDGDLPAGLARDAEVTSAIATHAATPHGGSLTSASAQLGANVTMTNANTWADGPTLSLAAGTWLVIATLTMGRAATGATAYGARISDGTTHHASTQFSQASLNPHVVSLTVAAVVTLAGTTTIRAQGVANVASSIIYAANTVNGTGNHASHIRALRVA